MESNPETEVQGQGSSADQGGLGGFVRASEYQAPEPEQSQQEPVQQEPQHEPSAEPQASQPQSEPQQGQFDWSGLGIEGVSSQEDLVGKWNETTNRIKEMEEKAKLGDFLSSQESNLGKAIIAAELEGKDASMIVDLYRMDPDNMGDSNAIFEKWYMENSQFVSDRNQAQQVFQSQNQDLTLAAQILAMPESEREDALDDRNLDASWLQRQKSIMSFEAAKAKQYLKDQKNMIGEYASKFQPSNAPQQQASNEAVQETIRQMSEWANSTNELKIALGDGKEVNMNLAPNKQLLGEIASDADKAVSYLLGGDAATVMRNAAIVAAMSNPESAMALAKQFASAMGEQNIEQLLDNPASQDKNSSRPDRKDESWGWSKTPLN